jgi:hypothetical protein
MDSHGKTRGLRVHPWAFSPSLSLAFLWYKPSWHLERHRLSLTSSPFPVDTPVKFVIFAELQDEFGFAAPHVHSVRVLPLRDPAVVHSKGGKHVVWRN